MRTPGLSVGAYGPDVQNLHATLKHLGYDVHGSEVEREFFGPSTRQALLEFQSSIGLKATGEADAPTIAATAAVRASPHPSIYADTLPSKSTAKGIDHTAGSAPPLVPLEINLRDPQVGSGEPGPLASTFR